MEDPVLNKSLEETRELQTRWNQFREFVRVTIERRKSTPEAEMKFLELKSIIAMLHDGFMAKLEHDQKTGQNIMSIVGDCIMLSRIANYNEAEKQKFEFDWNECYLLISEQVQALEQEQKRLAGISKRAWAAQRRKEMIKTKIHNFVHSAGLKFTITGAVLVMLLYVIPAHIWSYRNFNQIPGLNRIYELVAFYVWKPVFNSEYAYDSWDNLRINPDAGVADRVVRESTEGLGADYVKNSIFNLIGLSGGPYREAAVALLDGNVKRLETERFTADGQPVIFHYILFQSTQDARRFLEQLQRGFNDMSSEARNRVAQEVFVTRDANLVAIGVSEHGMRASLIVDKFKLKPEVGEKNLLLATTQ